MNEMSYESHARRRSLRAVLGVAIVAALLVGAQTLTPVGAERAQAAGLNCGPTSPIDDGKFTHTCNGKGTIQYTLFCVTYNTVRSYHWNESFGRTYLMSAACSRGGSALTVKWKIV